MGSGGLENRQSRILIAYWEGTLLVIFFFSAGRILGSTIGHNAA
jgi:hypothetical protein